MKYLCLIVNLFLDTFVDYHQDLMYSILKFYKFGMMDRTIHHIL